MCRAGVAAGNEDSCAMSMHATIGFVFLCFVLGDYLECQLYCLFIVLFVVSIEPQSVEL